MTPRPDPAQQLTERLHAEHASALFNWARTRVADRRDAEELVSETLVRAWRRYDQFDPGRGSERAWIFGIARNAAIDMHRRSQRRLRPVSDELPDVAVPGVVERIAEISLISDALADLSDQHRTVIVEAFVHGRDTNEIAARIGIPPGTVKSRMFYGMRSLRAALEEREVLT
jgi:RNA polymerase sigma-70 factor (ECF subfamily)